MTARAQAVAETSGRLLTLLREPVVPDVGVHPKTPMALYHSWAAASNSRLARLKRSPAHLKAYMDEPPESTQALAIGRAAHSAVLEPDTFDAHYTVAGQCQAIKKGDGQRCGNGGIAYRTDAGWLCGVHAKGFAGFDESRIVVPSADFDRCQRIRDAIYAHKSARALLSGAGEVELSLVWTDEATGVLCKARHDRHSPLIAGGAIVDLKTTTDASKRTFERSVYALGYHRQAAFYLAGAKAVGLPAEHFVIVAVEKEPPFGVGVYRVDEGALMAGQDEIAQLLPRYAECIAKDEWPCYSEQVEDIALPAYAWGQIDEDLKG